MLRIGHRGGRLELHQEIHIGLFGIEVMAPGGRAENLESAHMVTTTEFGDLVAMLFDQVVHR